MILNNIGLVLFAFVIAFPFIWMGYEVATGLFETVFSSRKHPQDGNPNG